jgi:hypothetical protein
MSFINFNLIIFLPGKTPMTPTQLRQYHLSMICTGASYPFFALVLLTVLKTYFRSTVRLAIMIICGVICLALAMSFARTPQAIVCRIMLYVTAGFPVVIWPMMNDYIDLTGRGITLKERIARQKAARELNQKNDPLVDDVNWRGKLHNHFRFFCVRKTPKSYI